MPLRARSYFLLQLLLCSNKKCQSYRKIVLKHVYTLEFLKNKVVSLQNFQVQLFRKNTMLALLEKKLNPPDIWEVYHCKCVSGYAN